MGPPSPAAAAGPVVPHGCRAAETGDRLEEFLGSAARARGVARSWAAESGAAAGRRARRERPDT